MNNVPGTEPSFAALLGGKMDTRINQTLRNRNPMSALDIGTEDGSALWYIYHKLPSVKILHGVDSATLRHVLRMQAKKGTPSNSIYELYQRWISSMTTEPSRAIKTVDEFNSLFDLRYDWDIRRENFERTYDMVIAGHVLHYLPGPSLESVMGKIRSAMAQDALVYVSIKQRPFSGYGTGNSWEYCVEVMREAAKSWGLEEHTLPERENHEGRAFVITNIY
jgi:hypothetical protein